MKREIKTKLTDRQAAALSALRPVIIDRRASFSHRYEAVRKGSNFNLIK